MTDLEREALAVEEKADIADLLHRVKLLPADSKADHLIATLKELRSSGYAQAMVFTQYTDTMDFLRDELSRRTNLRTMCFSGRGGEVPNADGTWRAVSRDDTKRRFRDGQADILLCTDAASEGLNFQFCGALINYDMPASAWMKRFAAPDMTDEFPGWQRQSAGPPVEMADRPGEIERAASANAMRLALQQNEANRPAYVGIWIVLSLALWALIALIISRLL